MAMALSPQQTNQETYRGGLFHPTVDIEFAKILPHQTLIGAQVETRIKNHVSSSGVTATFVTENGVPTYAGDARGLIVTPGAAGNRARMTFNRNNNPNFAMYLEGEYEILAQYSQIRMRQGSGDVLEADYITFTPFISGAGAGATQLIKRVASAQTVLVNIAPPQLTTNGIYPFRAYVEISEFRALRCYFELDGFNAQHTQGWQTGDSTTLRNPTGKGACLNIAETGVANQRQIFKRLQIQFMDGAYS